MHTRTIACCLLLTLFATGSLISACSTDGAQTKPASTRTAASAINEKIEEGKINVKGDADAAPLP